MSMQTHHSSRIVVGVDGQPTGRMALDWAIDLASQRHQPLHLVHAEPMPLRGPAVPPGADHSMKESRAVFDEAVARVHALAPGVEVTTATAHGAAAPLLVDASRDAALVVVGARGRGALRSALLGSTSVDVAAHAHTPVVVVRELSSPMPQRPRVVVGTDGSELSDAAVAAAFDEADRRDLPLTVVHAWQLDYADGSFLAGSTDGEVRREVGESEVALAAEAIAGWSQKYPDVVVHQHVLNVHPVQALVDHSSGAELVVVGSRGRGGFTGLLLGSVSQGVLHHAHCPVMVVRPGTGGQR
jgi:nucleotide-binding universal stress UspA family protein